jgi:hypothetical protein
MVRSGDRQDGAMCVIVVCPSVVRLPLWSPHSSFWSLTVSGGAFLGDVPGNGHHGSIHHAEWISLSALRNLRLLSQEALGGCHQYHERYGSPAGHPTTSGQPAAEIATCDVIV